MPDLRRLFTDDTAATTHPGLRMAAVPSSPGLRLDPDTVDLLRGGLGRYDMEVRWIAHLDASGRLRLWRSWTGYQVYEVTVVAEADGSGVLSGLTVEQDPDRHRGEPAAEPARFEAVLASVVNELRRLRAGHTPYGPDPGADPLPAPWP